MNDIKTAIIECNLYYLIPCRNANVCGISMLNEDEFYSYNQTCSDCDAKTQK